MINYSIKFIIKEEYAFTSSVNYYIIKKTQFSFAEKIMGGKSSKGAL